MPEKPYYKQLFEAVTAHDNEAFEEIIQECFVKMTHKFMGVVTSYDRNDLPVAVAVMKIAARTLEMTLDRNAKDFVDMLCSQTSSIAFDIDELKRQAREERENGKK